MSNLLLCGVYQYSFKNEQGRKYIGSSLNLKKRNEGHLSKLKLNKHESKDFQNDYNKYGLENLKYEILEFIDSKDYVNKIISKSNFKNYIFEREQHYLNLYFAQEYMINHKDTRFFKILYNKSVKAKYAECIDSKSKSVYRYSLSGIYLDEFYNSEIAAICFNTDSSFIRRACEFKRIKKAKGFQWRYFKSKNIPILLDWKKKPINQYTRDFNFVKRYNSVTEAREITKIHIRKGENQVLSGGYYWIYDNENFPEKLPHSKHPSIMKALLKEINVFLSEEKRYGKLKTFVEAKAIKYEVSKPTIYNLIYKTKKYDNKNQN